MQRCFLDIDGVLADFTSGICQAHGMTNPYLHEKNYGKYYFEDIWKITSKELLKPTDSVEFWEKLNKTPEFESILQLTNEYFGPDNVCLLTMPQDFPSSYIGKFKWIEKHLSNYKWLMGGCKEFCASTKSVLIDDSDSNVRKFRKFGGEAILFPRPWNSKHAEKNPINYIERKLLALKKRKRRNKKR